MGQEQDEVDMEYTFLKIFNRSKAAKTTRINKEYSRLRYYELKSRS